MKPKPAAFLDIKGYKQVLENSGLVPKYIKKKVFYFSIIFQMRFHLSSSTVRHEWMISVCAELWRNSKIPPAAQRGAAESSGGL